MKPVFINMIKRNGRMNRAIPLKHQYTGVNFEKGVSEFELGNFSSALDYFNKALVVDNDDAEAIFNRGLCYYQVQDIQHACLDWKYSAYLNVSFAAENYKGVCDSSIDLVKFRNSGMCVPPIVFTDDSKRNVIDSAPQYPGGEEALQRFISDNLVIKPEYRENYLLSRIVVKFTILESGKVVHPDALYYFSELGNEADRVVLLMPKWSPALIDGKQVACEYVYPVINGIDSVREMNKVYNEGVKSLAQADFRRAIELFTEVVRFNDRDNDAYYNRGICYLRMADTLNACLDWSRPCLKDDRTAIGMLNKYCNEIRTINNRSQPNEINSDSGLNSDHKTYTIVEKMPAFPGGEEAFHQFISMQTKYPDIARKSNISGNVYVAFIIDQEGNVLDPMVIRGIGGGCDEEALRVVKSMPKWSPGTQNGRPVNVKLNTKVSFSENYRK